MAAEDLPVLAAGVAECLQNLVLPDLWPVKHSACILKQHRGCETGTLPYKMVSACHLLQQCRNACNSARALKCLLCSVLGTVYALCNDLDDSGHTLLLQHLEPSRIQFPERYKYSTLGAIHAHYWVKCILTAALCVFWQHVHGVAASVAATSLCNLVGACIQAGTQSIFSTKWVSNRYHSHITSSSRWL